jgi:hypothetical protein
MNMNNEKETDKLKLTKNLNLCASQDIIIKVKRQPIE